jgi:hypothetical protein
MYYIPIQRDLQLEFYPKNPPSAPSMAVTVEKSTDTKAGA